MQVSASWQVWVTVQPPKSTALQACDSPAGATQVAPSQEEILHTRPVSQSVSRSHSLGMHVSPRWQSPELP